MTGRLCEASDNPCLKHQNSSAARHQLADLEEPVNARTASRKFFQAAMCWCVAADRLASEAVGCRTHPDAPLDPKGTKCDPATGADPASADFLRLSASRCKPFADHFGIALGLRSLC